MGNDQRAFCTKDSKSGRLYTPGKWEEERRKGNGILQCPLMDGKGEEEENFSKKWGDIGEKGSLIFSKASREGSRPRQPLVGGPGGGAGVVWFQSEGIGGAGGELASGGPIMGKVRAQPSLINYGNFKKRQIFLQQCRARPVSRPNP